MDGEIGTEELRSILEEMENGEGGENHEDVRVVDIRSPGAYSRGHIPGSENVPLQELVDDIEQFEGDDRVVTVCPKGKSSVQAARLIASYEGFDGRAESFAPGLSEWDGPVEKGGESVDQGPDDEGPAAPF
jgi:rhodanese-related sulfurtransferase